MPEKYNAQEVLDIALQIERNGARFYRAAAEAATGLRVKALLADLANMEGEHEDLFSELRGALPIDVLATAFDPEGAAALYLRAAADSHVFRAGRTTPEEMAQMKPVELLRAAIRFEKDSVVFFLGMLDLVPEELGRERVEGLLREEMGHIALLERTLRQLLEGEQATPARR